ncbi:MAG: hypothetical protein DIZ80_08005 [endosymbiont of Galathealinum brachiosum]|uniref:Uncharacterized protein n=1 Tax=endosymbiont of Galathealinum brachiosum TaxID=2200906 RepID=A0A370DIE6_9GAMM|nr:MAG: hypothetical protein DIZ80_08005 [endosymbiont of Galathealinum brachiosum]
MTRGGEFIPGHDSKLYSAIIKHVGGITNLRKLVEQSTGKYVVVHETLSSVYIMEDISTIWKN